MLHFLRERLFLLVFWHFRVNGFYKKIYPVYRNMQNIEQDLCSCSGSDLHRSAHTRYCFPHWYGQLLGFRVCIGSSSDHDCSANGGSS